MALNLDSSMKIEIHKNGFKINDEVVKLEYRNPISKVEESVVLKKSALTCIKTKTKNLRCCTWPISFIKKEHDDVYILTLYVNSDNKVCSVSTSDFFLEKNELLVQPN